MHGLAYDTGDWWSVDRYAAAMPMRAVDDETPPEVRRRLAEGWRAMPADRKAALIDAWSRDLRALAVAGLRERHPQAGGDELRRRLGVLLLGEQAVRAAFGGVPARR